VLDQRLGRLVHAALIIALLAGPLVPAGVRAQTAKNFKVTWNVDKSGPINTEVTGRVTNESRLEAYDVYLTVEALDDKGKVVARGLTHVSPLLRPAASEAFVAKVPVVPGVVSYRALISSFRFGLGPMQAP
jgi:hypothetical protein